MIRTAIAVVDDMFFISKIRETGKPPVCWLTFLATWMPPGHNCRRVPELILVDLHHQKLDAIQLASELKANER